MAHIDEFVHKLAEELEKNTASGNLKDIMISSMNEIIRKKIFGVSENLSLIENGRIDYYLTTNQVVYMYIFIGFYLETNNVLLTFSNQCIHFFFRKCQ